MKYIVVEPFKDVDGSWKFANDPIELDDARAAKLRKYGLIKRVREENIKPPETAKIELSEKAVQRKPRNKKKEQEIIEEEKIETEE